MYNTPKPCSDYQTPRVPLDVVSSAAKQPQAATPIPFKARNIKLESKFEALGSRPPEYP